jgi:hypothetical protein
MPPDLQADVERVTRIAAVTSHSGSGFQDDRMDFAAVARVIARGTLPSMDRSEVLVLQSRNSMKKSLLSIAAASMLVAGAGLVSAQTSTTTSSSSSWTNDQGATFTEYSKTKNYSSVNDPSLKPSVGMALPEKVTLYPLPETMKVPNAETYRYSIINNHPVVVESTSRKVVHSWD